MTKEEFSASPPYGTYSSFKSVVLDLGSKGLPHKIDRSTLASRSGSDQSALLNAFRWLKLIDKDGHPTKDMEDLSKSEEDYTAVFANIIRKSYPLFTDDNLDVKKGTTAQLQSAFQSYGISGSTLPKSITFFLNACKDAGIEVSAYFKAPRVTKSNNGAAKRKPKGKQKTVVTPLSSGTNTEMVDPDKYVTIPIPVFGHEDGKVILPKGLSEAEWNTAKEMIEFIIGKYEYRNTND